jgi:hypothetical protein
MGRSLLVCGLPVSNDNNNERLALSLIDFVSGFKRESFQVVHERSWDILNCFSS